MGRIKLNLVCSQLTNGHSFQFKASISSILSTGWKKQRKMLENCLRSFWCSLIRTIQNSLLPFTLDRSNLSLSLAFLSYHFLSWITSSPPPRKVLSKKERRSCSKRVILVVIIIVLVQQKWHKMWRKEKKEGGKIKKKSEKDDRRRGREKKMMCERGRGERRFGLLLHIYDTSHCHRGQKEDSTDDEVSVRSFLFFRHSFFPLTLSRTFFPPLTIPFSLSWNLSYSSHISYSVCFFMTSLSSLSLLFFLLFSTNK